MIELELFFIKRRFFIWDYYMDYEKKHPGELKFDKTLLLVKI